MGKPLSRPDCLRQNPPCVGKGEEEDLNIDDCYVPQRSIYDTVRLNEQIDSGSKGSLSSRHFTGTLPYTHRTLDLSSLCGNGVLSSSSAFELRPRKPAMLDERAVFDGLKLNGDIIRVTDTVLPKSRLQGGEKKDHPHHRRSWRTFAPAQLGEYASRSGTLCSDSVERPGLANGRRGQSVTSSLTSEDDSGLYSPTVERERRGHRSHRRPGPGTRSLSSSEAMHMSADLKTGRSLSSGQEEFPFSPARENLSRSLYHSSSLVQGPQQVESCLTNERESISNGEYKYSTGRLSSGSGSRTQNESSAWRSRTLTDYDELSTAELLEDVSSQEDCELVSVVVTQPETYGNSAPLAESHQQSNPCNVQHEAPKYSMEELEEFLQSVEACLPNGSLQAFQHIGEQEIETLLTAMAACPEMDLVGLFSSQVPRNSLFRYIWVGSSAGQTHVFLDDMPLQISVSRLLASCPCISDYMMSELGLAY